MQRYFFSGATRYGLAMRDMVASPSGSSTFVGAKFGLIIWTLAAGARKFSLVFG